MYKQNALTSGCSRIAFHSVSSSSVSPSLSRLSLVSAETLMKFQKASKNFCNDGMFLM